MGSVPNANLPGAILGSSSSAASRGNLTDGQAGTAVQKGVSQIVYTPGYVDTAIIIKWSIVGGLFLLLALWIVIGHFHARARQRKGLPLLFYHRYLVATPRRRTSEKAASQSGLDTLDAPEFYTPPPPAYDPNQPSPPGYQPSREIPELVSHQASPSELEQQTVQPKRSFLSRIRNLGRRSE